VGEEGRGLGESGGVGVDAVGERRQLANLFGRVAPLQTLRDLADPLLEPPLLGLEQQRLGVAVGQRALELLEVARWSGDQRTYPVAGLFAEFVHALRGPLDCSRGRLGEQGPRVPSCPGVRPNSAAGWVTMGSVRRLLLVASVALLLVPPGGAAVVPLTTRLANPLAVRGDSPRAARARR